MESKFTGSLLELIIVNIAAGLVSAFSLGLLIPWATCYRYRYLASHTIIDGNQLRFDGTAAQLWGQWFKWLFFIIITMERIPLMFFTLPSRDNSPRKPDSAK